MTARVCAITLILTVVGGFMAETTEAKDQAYSIRLGAALAVKPSTDQAFAFGTDGEYSFAGPFWFVYGGRLTINGDVFGWDLEIGPLLKFSVTDLLQPTFRATFMFGGISPLKDGLESNFVIGSSFGPGLRFRLGERAIFVDVGFEVGKFLREPKRIYFGILPMVGFEF